jgi:hypothetical protein
VLEADSLFRIFLDTDLTPCTEEYACGSPPLQPERMAIKHSFRPNLAIVPNTSNFVQLLPHEMLDLRQLVNSWQILIADDNSNSKGKLVAGPNGIRIREKLSWAISTLNVFRIIGIGLICRSL